MFFGVGKSLEFGPTQNAGLFGGGVVIRRKDQANRGSDRDSIRIMFKIELRCDWLTIRVCTVMDQFSK